MTATNTSDPAASVVLDIADNVVARGVVSVASIIHEQGQNSTVDANDLAGEIVVGPRDIFLLLSLLEVILRLPLLPQIISQLSGVCTSCG